MNHFTLLDIPQEAVIDLDTLKEHFQQLAAKNHPDNGGDEQAFQQVNQAYQILSVSHTRLKHLLELHSISFSPRGTVSDSVMASFMPIGELSQEISSHLQSVKKASSSLRKALLSSKSLELQEQVETWIDTLDSTEEQQLKDILDQPLDTPLFQTIIRNLAFLYKWKAELREHYSHLFSL